MSRLATFVRRNPVRVAAWVSSSVAIVLAIAWPDMDPQPVITFVLASLGLGEYAQRVEDAKTAAALAQEPPVEGIA